MALLALIVFFIAYVVFVYRQQLIQLWRLNRHCSTAFVKVPGPPCLPVIGAAHLFKWNDLGEKTIRFPNYLDVNLCYNKI
uniref:ORF8 n=1 Tax=Angiostrongylus cantonensis TaxID=6313 RepID=A0A0K0D3E7_ANGCA